jgi:hypothetical protein
MDVFVMWLSARLLLEKIATRQALSVTTLSPMIAMMGSLAQPIVPMGMNMLLRVDTMESMEEMASPTRLAKVKSTTLLSLKDVFLRLRMEVNAATANNARGLPSLVIKTNLKAVIGNLQNLGHPKRIANRETNLLNL